MSSDPAPEQSEQSEHRHARVQVELPKPQREAAPKREAPRETTPGAKHSILVQKGSQPESTAHARFIEDPRERGQHDRIVSGTKSPSPGVFSSAEEELKAAMGSTGRATIKQPSHPHIAHDDGKIHILLGITGSLHLNVIKQIICKLRTTYDDRASIQLIMTKAAENMIKPADIPSHVHVWHDEDEWNNWHHRTDPVIHIELRRWADVFLIAPCSANTVGKIALGLCDNLITNIVRAWNPQNPILIAPSMISYAYNSPATKFHLNIIKQEMKWIEILKPTEKVAGSYGGIGLGGMMAWTEITDKVIKKLGGYPDDNDDDDDNEDEAAIDQNKAVLREQQTGDENDSRHKDVYEDDDDDDES